jgi:3-methyladenine DNA glycosylase AlkC
MAEPFKHLLNTAGIDAVARHLQHAARAQGWRFDTRAFVAQAGRDLDGLEMKARAMQIAGALEATLPVDFTAGAACIEAALAPPAADDTAPTTAHPEAGLCGWMLWPVGEWVARRGLDQPERALATLHALTQRFTAEWAIRPFLVTHPALTFATLQRWCTDPSAHVRRLVSEGSRPRLPWGLQLRTLMADPSPTLGLLRALQDDPSEMVRRSVANHLNDIAKDHPQVVADWITSHLPDAPAPRRVLLRHAARTLIKQGHAQVLAAFGQGQPWQGRARLRITPRQARVGPGEAVMLTLSLASTAAAAQALAIDYAVHHVKADGSTRAKVFKGWQLHLAGGERRELERRHPLVPITTRRYHPGHHRVVVQINGQPVAEAAFALDVG